MSDETTLPPEPAGEAPASDAPPAASWMELALQELQQRRSTLEAEIRALEERRQQLEQDLGSSLSGQSDAIARRLKGFQDYLVGALQELAITAEQTELVVQPLVVQPSALDLAAAQAASSCSAPTR